MADMDYAAVSPNGSGIDESRFLHRLEERMVALEMRVAQQQDLLEKVYNLLQHQARTVSEAEPSTVKSPRGRPRVQRPAPPTPTPASPPLKSPRKPMTPVNQRRSVTPTPRTTTTSKVSPRRSTSRSSSRSSREPPRVTTASRSSRNYDDRHTMSSRASSGMSGSPSNKARSSSRKRSFRAEFSTNKPSFSTIGLTKERKETKDTATDGVRYKPLKSQVFPPSDPQPLLSSAPKEDLELEFVHGYQGQQARHNLFLLSEDEIAYYVGRLGVIYSLDRNEQRFFKEHKGQVRAMAVHAERQLAATAEHEAETGTTVYVWNTRTMEVVSTLSGLHASGIIAVAFTACGTGVLTLGNERRHAIGVWNADTGTLMGAAADLVLEGEGPLLDIATPPSHSTGNSTVVELWESAKGNTVVEGNPAASPHALVVGRQSILFLTLSPITDASGFAAAGDGDKQAAEIGLDVWIVDGKLSERAPKQTFMCGAFLKHGQAVVGCYDGSVYLFQDGSVVKNLEGHTAPVYGMCTSPMGLITVSKDGRLIRWSDSLTPTVCLHLGPHVLKTVDTIDGNDVVIGTLGNSILHVNLLQAIRTGVAITPASEVWSVWCNTVKKHHNDFLAAIKNHRGSGKVVLPTFPGLRKDAVVAPAAPRLRMPLEHIMYWHGWPEVGHDGSVRGKTAEELLGCPLTLGRALSDEWAGIRWCGAVTIMMQGTHSGIWGLASHPTLDVYTTVSDDGVLRLWDANTLAQLAQLTLPRKARCLCFHPRGDYLVVGLEAPSTGAALAAYQKKMGSVLKDPVGDDKVSAKGGGFLVVTVKGLEKSDTFNQLREERKDVEEDRDSIDSEVSKAEGLDIDFRVVQARCQPHRDAGVHCVSFSPDGASLAVAFSDSSIDVYSVALLDHGTEQEDVPHPPSPDRASVSSAGSSTTGGPKGLKPGLDLIRKKVLKAHMAPVVNMDWCVDSRYLATVSSAFELLHWEPLAGLRVKAPSTLRDTVWATQTCILGWPVRGIWRKDGSDCEVNAVARNRTGMELLSAVTEDGEVKLFQYPCHLEHAAHKTYSVHSNQVTNAAFLANDQRMVTVGADDRCVVQWRVHWSQKQEQGEEWFRKARNQARPESRRTTVFFREMKKAKQQLEMESKSRTTVAEQIEKRQREVAEQQRSQRVDSLLKRQMSAFASPTAKRGGVAPRGRGRGKLSAKSKEEEE